MAKLQTKLNGKTGHYYVKRAEIGVSAAGLVHIYADDGKTLWLSDFGELLVWDGIDPAVALKISPRDRTTMARLMRAAELRQELVNRRRSIEG